MNAPCRKVFQVFSVQKAKQRHEQGIITIGIAGAGPLCGNAKLLCLMVRRPHALDEDLAHAILCMHGACVMAAANGMP